MIYLRCYFELISTPGKQKNQACMATAGIQPATFGIYAGPMLCILSYAGRAIRICDISELTLCI